MGLDDDGESILFIQTNINNLSDKIYNNYDRDLRMSILEFENSVIYGALKSKEANKDFDLNKYLDNAKNELAHLNVRIQTKIEKAEKITEEVDKLSVDERKAIEEEYLKIIKLYHPVIRVFVSDEEKAAFGKMRDFYNDNNVLGIREIFELNKDAFKPIEYKPEHYTQVSGFFYENQKRINADYTKKVKEYPFNIGETLKDEITMARETGELRSKHTQLLRANQELKTAYKKIFNADFELK